MNQAKYMTMAEQLLRGWPASPTLIKIIGQALFESFQCGQREQQNWDQTIYRRDYHEMGQ